MSTLYIYTPSDERIASVLVNGTSEVSSSWSFRDGSGKILRSGVREVQQLLGHAKISTTQRYTNVIPIELKKVHAASHPSEHQRTPATVTPMRSRGSKWDALRRADE
ncbi:MAG TPA: hypothetical protein VGQ76_20160 [Thermoanaerobaculia bacterium]|nr:hypothetical protein [Thermoanaerobaculia bacterium]